MTVQFDDRPTPRESHHHDTPADRRSRQRRVPVAALAGAAAAAAVTVMAVIGVMATGDTTSDRPASPPVVDSHLSGGVRVEAGLPDGHWRSPERPAPPLPATASSPARAPEPGRPDGVWSPPTTSGADAHVRLSTDCFDRGPC